MSREPKFNDLFAFDLDGTLVHSNAAGERVIEAALVSCLENLAKISHLLIATGRRFRATLPEREVLPRMPYTVVHNGHVVKDADGKTVFREELKPDIGLAIFQAVQAEGLPAFFIVDGFEVDRDFVITRPSLRSRVIQGLEERCRGFVEILDDERDILQFTEAPLIEVAALAPYEMLIESQARLASRLPPGFFPIVIKNIGIAGYAALEFSKVSCTKWTGIQFVKKILHVERVIAVGDDENDREMISLADIGVVMSHAAPHILNLSERRAEGPAGLLKFLEEYLKEPSSL